MYKGTFIKYNLQFFADGEGENDEGTNVGNTGDNATDDGSNIEGEVDVSAFAELISEKDKVIAEQQDTINKLKKTNADLTLRISAGNRTEVTFEDNLLGLVGIKN